MWPLFTTEEIDAVSAVLRSNQVNYWTGQECRNFEKEFATFSDAKYAVAVTNGTVALDLAFEALGLGVGDEVIVTSRTFLASVSSIINAGSMPVFADVDLDTQNISPETVADKITDKTKAIVCVHLAGWPCDMDGFIALAEQHDLYIIEDCAQAHGAKYKGKSVGSIGHVGAWSFCQDKIMTTGGEGGMVTTNDELLWRKMWSFKDHGKSYEAVYEREHPPGYRWLHESFGTNWRMTEVQGVIGRIQLTRMKEWQAARLNNATKIWDTCRRFDCIRVPNIPKTITHAAYKCYVFVEPAKLASGWSRDRIMNEISEQGVPCFSGSCSEVYLEKAFDNHPSKPVERLPNAKELGETSLMFLVHPTLSEAEIAKTCQVLQTVMQQAAGD